MTGRSEIKDKKALNTPRLLQRGETMGREAARLFRLLSFSFLNGFRYFRLNFQQKVEGCLVTMSTLPGCIYQTRGAHLLLSVCFKWRCACVNFLKEKILNHSLVCIIDKKLSREGTWSQLGMQCTSICCARRRKMCFGDLVIERYIRDRQSIALYWNG